ncbi:hypothetical protein NUM_42700 [Actinocatenispora comari]|uniref:Uncharacterized protein n=1 Tax=Actinocatenispora comari TaxID=2807577 RepID=A0A8J4ELZ3_9ACTN|nr:hypothetical protein NUM_42700 [Actinocatenispora comari]
MLACPRFVDRDSSITIGIDDALPDPASVSDYRGRRLVKATSEAVTAVAIPTFISVLTSAVKGGDGEGTLRIAAVEINAAKLLLAHEPNLDPALRTELEMVAGARVGTVVHVKVLHAARHLDPQVERVREHETARVAAPGLEIGLSL